MEKSTFTEKKTKKFTRHSRGVKIVYGLTQPAIIYGKEDPIARAENTKLRMDPDRLFCAQLKSLVHFVEENALGLESGSPKIYNFLSIGFQENKRWHSSGPIFLP
jgi:hypothetical protein